MANKRMFSIQIVDSDVFLDMPLSTQNLYFHLNMRADDDGFIHNPKKLMRMIGACDDDLKVLLSKRYVLAFESGVIVIKHWKLHNTIQKDRYKPTLYQEEYKQLKHKENGVYTDSPELKDITNTKETKPLSDARKRRNEEKKNSDLPYSFEYKIRNAFTGKECPICGKKMSGDVKANSPSIQHNIPISLGGKHEIENISVICRGCNSSIQNHRETGSLNTEEVKSIWAEIGNGSGLDTQIRLDQSRSDKDSVDKSSKEKKDPRTKYGEFENVLLTDIEYNNCIERHGEDTTKKAIEKLSAYKASSGKKYKSDYATLNNWVFSEILKGRKENKEGGMNIPKFDDDFRFTV